MAGKMVEEVIVEGRGKIGGKKRVNDDKDAHPAKRAKVDDNEAAGCRNLGTKLQIDKAEGEGEEQKKEIDRISEVLEDDPKNLRKKDVEIAIIHLDVPEIIRLALKSDRANRGACSDYIHLEGGPFVPSYGKVLGLLTYMVLCGVEKLKQVDLYILYQNLPKMAFSQLLLNALGSNTHFDKMDRVAIGKLCYALPWKLFLHIMHQKTSLPQFKSSKEEEEESNGGECTDVEKKAAESCEICGGKGKHSGFYGFYCSFWDSVPSGCTVGSSHVVYCRECKALKSKKFLVKCHCGSRAGQAVPCSMSWEL